MIKAAVVGLGWWGQKLVTESRDSAVIRVTHAVHRRPERVAGFARENGLSLTDDYDAALAEDGIDAILIATPHSQHEDQVAAAAAAGKHVFCEKPVGLTKASAVASVEACRSRGLILGIGHERRWEPPMADMIAAARDGALGALLHIEANFSHDGMAEADPAHWRMSADEAPAGAMTATGIHMFDIATAILGPGAWAMVAADTLATSLPGPDTVGALVKYKSGPSVFVSSMLATPYVSRFAIYGRKGWIDIRDHAHIENSKGWQVLSCFKKNQIDSSFVAPTRAIRDNLEAFARAVNGEAAYPITPDEIIDNTAIMEAVFATARTGEKVMVP